jgi:Endonuclease/Exonuclease/phosphatase family
MKFAISAITCSLMLLEVAARLYAQEGGSRPLRIMFYNVENLFDTFDDTLKNDNDFLPEGVMKWNYSRYKKKISSLYKTIVAAGKWEPPGIVAMCEVENRKILEDLIYGTYLSKFKYRIVHEESPDPRGIDVCLICKSGEADIIKSEYWIPPGMKRGEFISRSVLYAKIAAGSDTLHLIVNHWPSRRGGVLAGEGLRKRISEMVREKTDSLIRCTPGGARIIVAGDFNCTPDDQEIATLTAPSDSGRILVNLSGKRAGEGLGTYRYRGTWEMIDQVMVSDFLLNCSSGLYTGEEMLTIFSPDFLLMKDPSYPGFIPHSTYRGYRYQGGFSDHLPVLLDLDMR